MKKPKTNTQEILLTLINKGNVSIFDYPYLSGFRTRISELVHRHKIDIRTTYETGKNKFGNTYKYALHWLVDKDQAQKVYEEMTKNNPEFAKSKV